MTLLLTLPPGHRRGAFGGHQAAALGVFEHHRPGGLAGGLEFNLAAVDQRHEMGVAQLA